MITLDSIFYQHIVFSLIICCCFVLEPAKRDMVIIINCCTLINRYKTVSQFLFFHPLLLKARNILLILKVDLAINNAEAPSKVVPEFCFESLAS